MIESEVLAKTWERETTGSFIYAIEEMAELTKELCKSLEGRGNTKDIAQEIADVLITVGILKYIDLKVVEEKKSLLIQNLKDKL